jgi:anti-sigma factor RsiW
MEGWREGVGKVRCKKIRWMLALHGSGELSAEEQDLVEIHLASCEKCRQELARLSEVPSLVQSLHGDTWWADVSASVRERLSTSGAESSPPQAKPSEVKISGMRNQRATWQPGRVGSLAAAVVERPIWQPLLIGLLAVIIVVGASLAVVHPWAGDNMIQAAADLARNDPQVRAMLGEGEIETEVVLAGEIAYVECRLKDIFDSAVVNVTINTEDMTVIDVNREATAIPPP